MNWDEYCFVLADIGAIKKLLSELPEDHQLERMGLESRKRKLEQEIAELPEIPKEPVRMGLSFRGEPIVDRYGISTDFSADALKSFVKVIASIGTNMEHAPGSQGDMPNQDEFDLLITEMTKMPCGFQLESMGQNGSPFDRDFLRQAIKKTQMIMQATTESDEEFEKAIANIDPQALDVLKEFLDMLEENDTICGLWFKGKEFRFSNIEQLRRSIVRLCRNAVDKNVEILHGRLLGILPRERLFEFQIEGEKDTITGKIDQGIEEPSELNCVLLQPISISVSIQHVGAGEHQYSLLECPSLLKSG